MISNINMNDFLKQDGFVNIIDIRSIEKFNNGHIPGAVNIPFEKIITQPHDYLDKDIKYYIYCQRGTTSYKVCGILTNLGYTVVNINGGYESWILNRGYYK